MTLTNIKRKNIKLSDIGNMLYLLSFDIMCVITSAGLTSSDDFYQNAFFVSMILLFISSLMSVSKFRLKELIKIVAMIVLLSLVYVISGEVTLILTFSFIIFYRWKDYNQVLKVFVIVKSITTIITIYLAANNMIENAVFFLPKGNGELFALYSYGYITPNIMFGNIFCIVFTAIIMNYEKIKFYHLMIVSVFLYYLYTITVCRSGMITWIVFIIVWTIDKVSIKQRFTYIKYIYIYFFPFMFLFSVITCILKNYGSAFASLLDLLLTGRITIMTGYLYSAGITLFGSVRPGTENIYIKLLCGYGVIISFILIIGYIVLCKRLIKHGMRNIAIGLVIFCIYGFVEQFALNIAYNPLLLYFCLLFSKRQKIDAFDVKVGGVPAL